MTTQSPVTVRAELAADQGAAVAETLELLGGVPAGSTLFADLTGVHFARVFVLDTVTLMSGQQVPASLVYMADVDGSVTRHLHDLVSTACVSVDALFGHCLGYPPHPTDRERVAWLRAHTLAPAAAYVHTAGRTLQRIEDESRLFACLGEIIDAGEVPVEDADPAQLRRQLRQRVLRRPGFSWIKTGPRGQGLFQEARDGAHLLGILALLLLAAPFLPPIAALWLLLVRIQELSDGQEEGQPAQSHVDDVRRHEDLGAQNPFTAIGEIKPGVVRQLTMRVALAGLGFACRHAYARDNLAGVDSIHFARWVLLDDNRRLVFASSYDGSLESYMDDFISRLAWGINLVFSNGVGFPRARWLVLGGARDEITYKHYLRRHQVPTPVYYSAYPGRTAVNLDAFTQVHAGISARDVADPESWLARL